VTYYGKTRTLPLPETGFLRLPVVMKYVPFKRSTIYQKVKDGSFPAPCKLSPRVVAWKVEDIIAWIALKGGARP